MTQTSGDTSKSNDFMDSLLCCILLRKTTKDCSFYGVLVGQEIEKKFLSLQFACGSDQKNQI